MVALQIRRVPDDVRRALAERAAAGGQSLQSFLLGLVTDEAHRSANLGVLERFAGRTDGSRVTVAGVVQELDEARSARERQLAGPIATP